MVETQRMPPPTRPPRRRMPLWPFVVGLLLVLLSVVAVWGWNVELPYFAFQPGPVYDVVDLIEVDPSVETHPPRGDFLMLTVSLEEVNAFEFVVAYLDPTVDLVAREAVRPADISPEEYRRINLDLMEESKNTAIFVALSYLGYDVKLEGEGVIVEAIIEGTPAEEALQPGDIVIEVNGVPVRTAPDAIAEITSYEIGDTITLTVLRDGEEVEVQVTLVEHTQNPGAPMVGFLARTLNRTYALPFDIDIDISNVGGPSAGLMYTLAIIDVLSEEDLTHGLRVAGTGTIDSTGDVGAIGGVRQKVVAAQDAGATVILVPEENYDDAVTMLRDGHQLYPVDVLEDALRILREEVVG